MWILYITVVAVLVALLVLVLLIRSPPCPSVNRPPTTPQGLQGPQEPSGPQGPQTPIGSRVLGPVVGAIVADDYVSPLPVSSMLSPRPLDDQYNGIQIPVDTILLNESPLDVRAEYITQTTVQAPPNVSNLPGTFDARQQWPGLITDPLHQGACGSCWAFATCTAVSDRFRIADPNDKDLRIRFMYSPFVQGITYPVLNNLSPYELASCDICSHTKAKYPITTAYIAGDDGVCDDGCSGGYIQMALTYIANQGVPLMYCSPPLACLNPPAPTQNPVCVDYSGPTPKCPGNYNLNDCNPATVDCPCCPKPTCKLYRPAFVHSTFEATDSPDVRRQRIMAELFTKGPVTAGFKVYQSFYDWFNKNPTGVYTTAAQPANDRYIGGHAIDIIGWGTDPTAGFYWLIRNSWGIDWGDHGFFKMQFDGFSILDQVMDAEVMGTNPQPPQSLPAVNPGTVTYPYGMLM